MLIAGARIHETVQRTVARRSLRREIVEGLRWAYRHPTLGPLAWSTHVWFVANAAALTVLAVFALRTLGFSPALYGLLFAVAGVATLAGASIASWAGSRYGSGATITVARAAYPVAWALVAMAPSGETPLATTFAFTGLALQGLAGGVENANEMSLRQAVTPDALLGRTNGTLRAANRSMAVVGALAGGLSASLWGVRPTLLAVVGLFLAAFLVAAMSPLRSADTGAESGPS